MSREERRTVIARNGFKKSRAIIPCRKCCASLTLPERKARAFSKINVLVIKTIRDGKGCNKHGADFYEPIPSTHSTSFWGEKKIEGPSFFQKGNHKNESPSRKISRIEKPFSSVFFYISINSFWKMSSTSSLSGYQMTIFSSAIFDP